MSTPVFTIDATGGHKPDFETVRAWIVAQYRGIYGDDVYLEPDSQDGQLLSLFAQAIHDCNSVAAAVYNSRGPQTAQGEGLSSIVKINNIKRAVATFSTVDIRIVGEVGTIIEGGIVADEAGARWLLPSVTIPIAGEITVTATAKEKGAITALADTITNIVTPTRGWQTASNPSAATPGAPIETDAALRRRQAISTSIDAASPLESIKGAIAALTGVQRVEGYENDTDATDANGIPSHSMSFVVDGGTDAEIASIIAAKKTIGTGTFGSVTVQVADTAGVLRPVRFFRPTLAEVGANVTIKALAGYSTARATAIKQAIVDWVNALAMGDDVIFTRAFMPANLFGDPAKGASTFEITSLAIGRIGGAFAASDISVGFHEAAWARLSGINVTVTA